MKRSALLASTAVALILGMVSANAQTQQRDEKSSPSTQHGTDAQRGGSAAEQKSQQGTAQGGSDNGQKGTDTSGAERQDSKDRGTAERRTDRDDRKGTAERSGEHKDKSSAGRQAEPSDRKGTAEKSGESPKGAERDAPSRDKAAATDNAGPRHRVQLTDAKRGNINQTILKDREVNRVTSVNFSINVGTRVPDTVRLVALPAAVIEIVPEFRSYRYFVVGDQICIVEPSTHEIVEVIRGSDRTASREGHASADLTLTEREKEILLREIDLRNDSTLALGALTEGAEMPRDVNLKAFPAAVVEQVPKLRDYKYVSAERRLAIVDPRASRIELVIEQSR